MTSYRVPLLTLQTRREYQDQQQPFLSVPIAGKDGINPAVVLEIATTNAAGAVHRQWFYADDYLELGGTPDLFVPTALLAEARTYV